MGEVSWLVANLATRMFIYFVHVPTAFLMHLGQKQVHMCGAVLSSFLPKNPKAFYLFSIYIFWFSAKKQMCAEFWAKIGTHFFCCRNALPLLH